ncbi:endopeptidase Clp [Teladorsagia circumcincta]|uniref:ATP-dependent Clp protease proteolytic subunit n=1 Tax=Teladorsagia circumcincta TaxID=45464 RepID=A0A2G9UQK5_TELCI|nr:endopeptidase Clp [Teladorsagia circumcincta]
MLLRGLLPGLRQCIVGIRREFTATPSLSAIPFVIENEGRGERSYDIYSRLLRDRIVCVMTPVAALPQDSQFMTQCKWLLRLWPHGVWASMGSLLLCAGEKGMRTALPNSRIMVHQPSGGAQGTCSDIVIRAEEIQRLKKRTQEIYVHHTGQTYEVIQETLDRDRFMSAYEAMKFGIIDKVESHKGSMPTE